MLESDLSLCKTQYSYCFEHMTINTHCKDKILLQQTETDNQTMKFK